MSKNIGNLQDKDGNSLFPNAIETITNSNGTALKFADGTMICYGGGKGTNDGSTVITFAIPFINSEYRVASFIVASNENYIRTVQIKAKTASTMTIYLQWLEKNSTLSGLGADTFDYIAIGRWK